MRTKTQQSAPDAKSDTLTVGNLTIDKTAGRAYVDGFDLSITKAEFDLLNTFALNEGKTMNMEEIYDKSWKLPMVLDKRSLQRRISEVRTKLSDGNCSHTINNTYGVGYCFEQRGE